MKWLVRIGGAAAIVGSVVVFFVVAPGCGAAHACPGYALASPWVLKGERALASLVGTTILLLAFVRLVVEGRLPDRVSRDGMEWDAKAAAGESQDGIAALERIVDDQRTAIERLSRSTRSSVKSLADRVAALEPTDD